MFENVSHVRHIFSVLHLCYIVGCIQLYRCACNRSLQQLIDASNWFFKYRVEPSTKSWLGSNAFRSKLQAMLLYICIVHILFRVILMMITHGSKQLYIYVYICECLCVCMCVRTQYMMNILFDE